jgi:4-aminobutyrate aminotransferase
VIESEGLLERATRLGAECLRRGEQLRATHPIIGEVRGLGLLFGIELIKPGTNERAIDEAEKTMYAALTRGLNFKVSMGNILTLTPPLTITDGEIATAFEILAASLAEAVR